MARRALQCSVAALGLVGLVGAAPAAATLTLSPGPGTTAVVNFPHPGPVTYDLRITATSQDETFALETVLPSFGGPLGTATAASGAALQPAGVMPRVEGAARVLGPARFVQGYVACGPGLAAHGTDFWRLAWDFTAPAGTTSDVFFTFDTPTSAPWPTTSYDLRFTTLPRLVERGPTSVTVPQEVTLPGPRATGRVGIRMTMTSRPHAGLVAIAPVTRVSAGRLIVLSGTTAPAVADARVVVRVGEGSRVRSFTARTDRRGRYHARVRARRPGPLSLSANILARRPVDDGGYTCPLGFEVQPPTRAG